MVHLSAGDLLRAEKNKPGSKDGELISSYIKEGKIVQDEGDDKDKKKGKKRARGKNHYGKQARAKARAARNGAPAARSSQPGAVGRTARNGQGNQMPAHMISLR